MVSCPRPDHLDKIPSAWLNSENNTWFCGACDIGGDIMDLAGIRFGVDYRSRPDEFPGLLEQALASIDVDVDALRAGNVGKITVAPTRPRDLPSTEPSEEPLRRAESFDEVHDIEDLPGGNLDWREIVACYPDSFLAQWMEAVSPSRAPDEYLFWLGIQAIGLALGRNVWLNAETPVYPNLLLAVIGSTGMGKSHAVKFVSKLLRNALPHDPEDPDSKGIRIMGRPASGEALLEMFSWTPPGAVEPKGLRGLVDVDEMSELMAATKRRGATLKETIITLSDGREQIEHTSRSTAPIVVNDPFMSMIVGCQPDAMYKVLDSVDAVSGFANRFVYVAGSTKPRVKWHDRPTIDLTGLDLKLQNIRAWGDRWHAGRDGGSIDMDLVAAQDFDDMMVWLDDVRAQPGGDIFARLELHAMKLVVILCANCRITEADQTVVQNVRRMIESLVPTTKSVSDAITRSVDEWYADRVMTYIERCEANGKVPPSRREIEKNFTASKRDKTRISSAITYLEKIGRISRIRVEVESTGLGVPRLSTTWRFEINH